MIMPKFQVLLHTKLTSSSPPARGGDLCRARDSHNSNRDHRVDSRFSMKYKKPFILAMGLAVQQIHGCGQVPKYGPFIETFRLSTVCAYEADE